MTFVVFQIPFNILLVIFFIIFLARYLEEIAKEYKVDWVDSSAGLAVGEAAVPSPSGYSIPMAPGSLLQSAYDHSPSLLQQQQQQQQSEKEQQQFKENHEKEESQYQKYPPTTAFPTVTKPIHLTTEYPVHIQAISVFDDYQIETKLGHEKFASNDEGVIIASKYHPPSAPPAYENNSSELIYQEHVKSPPLLQSFAAPPVPVDDLAARFAALQKKN
jgi:hypothetical protein